MTPDLCTKIQQKSPGRGEGGTSRKIGWRCATRALKPLPYFRPKSVIFPTLFHSWSPGARRVNLVPRALFPGPKPGKSALGRGCPARDKLLRHVHGWRNIKREMVLSPNDEEVASSKKDTQFKTRVPINHTLFHTKAAKKKHTLCRRTYHSLYKGVPLRDEKRVADY